MTRIKILDRDEMTAEQGQVYDEAKASGGPVGGPYYAYIRLPELMRRSQALRACLHSGPLSGRERQIINLMVARHWGAKYPWVAQVRGAVAVGLDQAIIDAINHNETPGLDDPREQAIYQLAGELLTSHRLSDGSYSAAEAVLGLEDLVAAVANVGQFGMTCCTANAFDVTAPADAPTPLADL